MLILNYPSKKELKTKVGQPLDYTETSLFGAEYRDNGRLVGSNRPQMPQYPKHSQRGSREFFAQVTMVDGLIAKVE